MTNDQLPVIDEAEAQQQIKQLDISADDAKRMIKMKDDILQLLQNPLWKKVIDQGFFRDEPHRLVLLRAEFEVLNDPIKQKDIENQLTAVGGLWQWLKERIQLGRMATKTLAQAEETKDEILTELGGQ